MSFQDIQLIVNDQRVGPTSVIGAQPDVSFFMQIKEHLHGDCRVVFRVGDQRVESNVALRGTQFLVDNDFVESDIDGFIANQKERVRKEQLDANFSEELTDVYFLPSAALLDEPRLLPSFDRSKLVKDPAGPKFVVSHRWQSVKHPDPQGAHLAILKRHASEHRNAFYWIDYSCLPQSRNKMDDHLFRTTLPKIAIIQAKSSTIVIPQSDYAERLWCFVEQYAGVLFSQTNLGGGAGTPRTIEYLGPDSIHREIVDMVQTLVEPAWDRLGVTNPSDIPGVKYNYTWLANLVKFQLYDRFTELRRSLPGHDIYSGQHYFQSAFGIDYRRCLESLRSLFIEFGGDIEYFYKPDSLLWLAERFSWSVSPDDFKADEFRFSEAGVFSRDMVGWLAMLLAIIEVANRRNKRIVNCRDLYSRIVLMSMYA